MTDLLDLPPIDIPHVDTTPAGDTALAVAQSAAVDLSKVDIHDVVRAQFAARREEAEQAAKDLSKVVLDLPTQSKIDEAKSLRERRINAPVAETRKLGKGQRSSLSQAGKTSSATEAEVVAAFIKAGESLTTQIDAAQKKVDDEREAKRLAEEKRLADMRSKVDGILAKWLNRCGEDGITGERIEAGVEALRPLAMPADVKDVAAHWDAVKAETVSKMTKLQQEQVAREQAAKQRLLDEQAAELARQQEEIEAARERVNAPGVAAAAAGSTEGKAENPEPGTLEAAPITAAPMAIQPTGLAVEACWPATAKETATGRAEQPTAAVDEAEAIPLLEGDTAQVEADPVEAERIGKVRLVLAGPEDHPPQDDLGEIDVQALCDRALDLVVLLREVKQSKVQMSCHWWQAVLEAVEALAAHVEPKKAA